jgi:hypothetical protein
MDHDEYTAPPQPPRSSTGVGLYATLGAFLLLGGVGAGVAAASMLRSTGIDLEGLFSGKAVTSDHVIPATGLASLSNSLTILGIGMIFLAVVFDLLHRYRRASWSETP